MKWKVSVLACILHVRFPGAEAQSFGLLDPKLCYLLDGILFIYGVIITALYLRAKFSRSAETAANLQDPNQLYNELNLGRREEYDVLEKKRARDPEMGGKQQRRRNPQEGVYNALQKDKMAEAYSEIGTKGERRRGKGHDGLYQDSHFQAVQFGNRREREGSELTRTLGLRARPKACRHKKPLSLPAAVS
uniref:T-cell surface glycoprotein CD3 zeta chain n=1 Tax=Mus musculus TaxID=10090 RepID=J3QMU3_MOUSE